MTAGSQMSADGIGVPPAQVERVAHRGETDRVAAQALVDALLHLRIDAGDDVMGHASSSYPRW